MIGCHSIALLIVNWFEKRIRSIRARENYSPWIKQVGKSIKEMQKFREQKPNQRKIEKCSKY
jgi:hypothetical protein